LLLFWVLFNVFVVLMLAVDLFLFHRPAHRLTMRQALTWSGTWITLAAAFAVLLYFRFGHNTALEFTTGYIVEFSLSVDNLFLFLVIFRYFQVPSEFQHKVLFWGIIGAIVMRGVFILVGIRLISAFHWIIYIFGAFLIYTGIKLWTEEHTVAPEKNPILGLLRRWVPVTASYQGEKFFIRNEKTFATPLLIVLLMVETTDLLFATDSIPAILAITLNAFVVYTSNVFAILGLRSFFFVLAGLMQMFHYLHYGLSVVLMFVGLKMLASHYVNVPTEWALAIVLLVLAASIVASIALPKQRI